MELFTNAQSRRARQNRETALSLMAVDKTKLSKENQRWPVVGINKGQLYWKIALDNSYIFSGILSEWEGVKPMKQNAGL